MDTEAKSPASLEMTSRFKSLKQLTVATGQASSTRTKVATLMVLLAVALNVVIVSIVIVTRPTHVEAMSKSITNVGDNPALVDHNDVPVATGKAMESWAAHHLPGEANFAQYDQGGAVHGWLDDDTQISLKIEAHRWYNVSAMDFYLKYGYTLEVRDGTSTLVYNGNSPIPAPFGTSPITFVDKEYNCDGELMDRGWSVSGTVSHTDKHGNTVSSTVGYSHGRQLAEGRQLSRRHLQSCGGKRQLSDRRLSVSIGCTLSIGCVSLNLGWTFGGGGGPPPPPKRSRPRGSSLDD